MSILVHIATTTTPTILCDCDTPQWHVACGLRNVNDDLLLFGANYHYFCISQFPTIHLHRSPTRITQQLAD